jgi:hypothetical protein
LPSTQNAIKTVRLHQIQNKDNNNKFWWIAGITSFTLSEAGCSEHIFAVQWFARLDIQQQEIMMSTAFHHRLLHTILLGLVPRINPKSAGPSQLNIEDLATVEFEYKP